MLFVWILLYGLVFSLGKLSSPGWIPPLGAAVYTAALLLWCCRGSRQNTAGLCAPRTCKKADLWFLLPMAALPLWQVIYGGIPALPPGQILLILSAVLAEEIFFRGFALSFLRVKCPKAGVLLSAALFALFHCVNLLAGWDPGYVILQILLAFIAGIYWGLLRLRFGSILPGILAHGLINLTGSAHLITRHMVLGISICCLIMALSSILLYKSLSFGGNS